MAHNTPVGANNGDPSVVKLRGRAAANRTRHSTIESSVSTRPQQPISFLLFFFFNRTNPQRLVPELMLFQMLIEVNADVRKQNIQLGVSILCIVEYELNMSCKVSEQCEYLYKDFNLQLSDDNIQLGFQV